ncbi:DUF4157 domain-containing protein [Vitiosangium sp. GDMCC 1.1324]|uniref:eCIS core domain-containing protein n=1 Tax=Vitiosangium sp. (strain GDMCC 1.1324) TaxID=2138576 RepID=UPI000D355158|nr:DUF4157 domain-containing protein [Vitiosangium sp. GDMCC 1.1324]PTL85076.1 hypothetical protein DAT35_08540 [Vitiosangium sp. GDMCC 1.1324]
MSHHDHKPKPSARSRLAPSAAEPSSIQEVLGASAPGPSAGQQGHHFEHIPLRAARASVSSSGSRGLPDELKAGIERLSGMAMDDVRVHYNSSLPAGLRASAYTAGTEIHVGPGQERHLPHEAWHVVQQKQGRVRPTTQAGGASLNLDSGLEGEADRLGASAMRGASTEAPAVTGAHSPPGPSATPVIQGYGLKHGKFVDFENEADAKGALIKDNFLAQQKQERAAELENLRTGKIPGWNKARPSKVRGNSNNFLNKQLSEHLVSSGRASKLGGADAFVTKAQVTEGQNAAVKNRWFNRLRGLTPKDLTAKERQAAHPLAKKRAGGPDEKVKNAKMGEILRRMEVATNQSYVADALYEKGKKNNNALKPHESLNATHEALMKVGGDAEKLATSENVHPKLSHFYGRHGAQISKADQLSRIAAGVVPDRKPTPAPATTTQVTGGPGVGTVDLPNYSQVGDDEAGGMASGGFSSHEANLYAIEETLAQAWNRPAAPTQTVEHSHDELDETVAPSTTTQHKQDVTLHKQKQYDADVNLPKPQGTAGKPLFEGGFGTSYMYKGAKLTKGAALTGPDLSTRVTGITAHTDQQSAHVILQGDANRGGFSVHTAYPQQAPAKLNPGETALKLGYTSQTPVPVSHKKVLDGGGATKYQRKNKAGGFDAEKDAVPQAPLAKSFALQPTQGGKDEDTRLTERMDRLEKQGRTHRYDSTRPQGHRVVEESIADAQSQKDARAWLKRRLNKLNSQNAPNPPQAQNQARKKRSKRGR